LLLNHLYVRVGILPVSWKQHLNVKLCTSSLYTRRSKDIIGKQWSTLNPNLIANNMFLKHGVYFSRKTFWKMRWDDSVKVIDLIVRCHSLSFDIHTGVLVVYYYWYLEDYYTCRRTAAIYLFMVLSCEILVSNIK
jgi:hypothetical protein